MEANKMDSNWKKRFFTIWSGQIFSVLGSSLVQFALVWWLTSTTGSASVLAIASLMAFLPQVFLSPFVGALVDRWNRRAVMMIADSSISLASLALAFLFWQGHIQVWQVYIVLFIRAVGDTFHRPAMQASTSLMVPDQHLARVAGLNQMLNALMMIVSPPLGALLVSILPFYSIIAIDVITALLAVVPLIFFKVPQPEQSFSKENVYTPRLLLKDVVSGLRYVRGMQGVLILLIMISFINFFGNPLGSMMPLLVTQHFHGGAVQLGWLEFTAGIAMLVGALTLSIWGGARRRILSILVAMIVTGIGSCIVGWTPSNAFWLTLMGATIFGLSNPFLNGPFQAILQSRVAPEMQGRVFSLVSSISQGVVPLGLIFSAQMVGIMGITFLFKLTGLAVLITGIIGFLIPSVIRIENQAQPDQPPIISDTLQSKAGNIP